MPQNLSLHIEGMTCSHCQSHVEKTLTSTAGVQSATVSLSEHLAKVQVTEGTPVEALIAAIEDAGFSARAA